MNPMNESPYQTILNRPETPTFAWGYYALYPAITHQLDTHMLSHSPIAAYTSYFLLTIDESVNILKPKPFYRKAHMSSKKLLEQCQKLEKLWGHVLTGLSIKLQDWDQNS